MQTADRPDFVAQLRQLCAGYNVPFTQDREDSYWRGLSQMRISDFARVVDHALSEDGPESFPNTRKVWALHRQVRRSTRAAPPTETAPQQVDALALDGYAKFANRVLWRFLYDHNGAAPESMPALIAEKSRVTDQIRLVATEERVTAEEFTEALFSAFRRVYQAPACGDIEADRQRLCRERRLNFEPREVVHYRRIDARLAA